jgi:hypothetical protein
VFYTITGKRLSAALVTQDGVVKHATANCDWARGQRIGTVLAWASEQGMTWSVSSTVPAALVLNGRAVGEGQHASHPARSDPPRAQRLAQSPGAGPGGPDDTPRSS